MVIDREFHARPVKKTLFTIATIAIAISLLSNSSIIMADTFNGPTELSSQDFKDLNINGPANLSKITADSLTVRGPLNFTKVTVKGKTEIAGPTSGDEGDFKDVLIHGTFWGSKFNMANLHVDGDVTIENFKITGKVTINGPLKAKNGSFNNIETVNTPVALYNVNVNNITVNNNRKKDSDKNTKDDNTDNSNVVKLAGNTVVSGNITFESGNGIVFIRDKTAQLKGKVIGGKIKEQSTANPAINF